VPAHGCDAANSAASDASDTSDTSDAQTERTGNAGTGGAPSRDAHANAAKVCGQGHLGSFTTRPLDNPCDCEFLTCERGRTCSYDFHFGMGNTYICACNNGTMACCNLTPQAPHLGLCSFSLRNDCPRAEPKADDPCGPDVAHCIYCEALDWFCDGVRWRKTMPSTQARCPDAGTDANGADSAPVDASTADG
jgi:hypothetical protein